MLGRASNAFRKTFKAIGSLARQSQAPHPGADEDQGSVKAWLARINDFHDRGLLSEQSRRLIVAHDINLDGHAVNSFSEKIEERCGESLRALLVESVANAEAALEEIIKWKTAIQCADSHDRSKGYFHDAEPYMDQQWNQIIYPVIKDSDFSVVVDLACGHGRNSEYLRRLSKELHLVDINQSCLDACKERFGNSTHQAQIFYHLTIGNSLHSLADDAISFVYSWDSMVHFDKLIVADYTKEIARVLIPGGSAFLHHSNYGSISPDSDWAKNLGTRSDMSAELMTLYAQDCGLEVLEQKILGTEHGWGADGLDCISLLRKPMNARV